MSLRWKVLFLLLTSALAPLAAAYLVAQRSTRSLGNELATMTRESLTRDAEQFLLQTVRDHGRLLRLEGASLEHNLRIQAREVERALASPPPETYEIRFSPELEREPLLSQLSPSDRHSRRTDDGSLVPMRVDYEHPSFLLSPDADRAAAEDDLARLTTLVPAYVLIREFLGQRVLWQYTALQNGVHTAYPGHGYYPETFDPRQRNWYRVARDRGDLMWTAPMVDASTRHAVLTCSHPIYREDGSFAGVTAIDVRITEMVSHVELPEQWAGVAETMIVVPMTDAQAGVDYIMILARQEYATDQSWDVAAIEDALLSADAQQLTEMRADLVAQRPAVRTMRYEQDQCLWAYGPLTGTRAALVAIVPYEVIHAPALAAEAQVQQRAGRQRALMAWLIAGVVLVVFVLSIHAASQVTRPIEALAAAAHRIADGDLNTRADVETRDEIGELGQSFNQMLPQLRDRLKLKQSLALAMEVQQSLLPETAPSIPGLDVAGQSIYCDETGGDYYDFVELTEIGPSTLGVAVGDVTGHGIAAALLMATARAFLRARADQPNGLGALLNHINAHLADDMPEDKFITLCYMMIDARTRTLRWTSAGHDPAILYDARKDEFQQLAGGGIPLGIEPAWNYEELGPMALEPGQIIVIGTDGIWEARDADKNMFGKERLRRVIRETAGRTADQISRAITRAVTDFRGSRFQDDDITLVVIKVPTE